MLSSLPYRINYGFAPLLFLCKSVSIIARADVILIGMDQKINVHFSVETSNCSFSRRYKGERYRSWSLILTRFAYDRRLVRDIELAPASVTRSPSLFSPTLKEQGTREQVFFGRGWFLLGSLSHEIRCNTEPVCDQNSSITRDSIRHPLLAGQDGTEFGTASNLHLHPTAT